MSQIDLFYSMAKFLATQCRSCDGTGKLKMANQSAEGYHYSEAEPCLDCEDLRRRMISLDLSYRPIPDVK